MCRCVWQVQVCGMYGGVTCVGVWHVWVCGYLDDICNS